MNCWRVGLNEPMLPHYGGSVTFLLALHSFVFFSFLFFKMPMKFPSEKSCYFDVKVGNEIWDLLSLFRLEIWFCIAHFQQVVATIKTLCKYISAFLYFKPITEWIIQCVHFLFQAFLRLSWDTSQFHLTLSYFQIYLTESKSKIFSPFDPLILSRIQITKSALTICITIWWTNSISLQTQSVQFSILMIKILSNLICSLNFLIVLNFFQFLRIEISKIFK